MRTKLARLRANKSLLLKSSLHTINPDAYSHNVHTMLDTHTHNINHLFNCSQIPTQHNPTSLWQKHLEAREVIQKMKIKIGFFEGLRIKRWLLQDILGGKTTTTLLLAKLGLQGFKVGVARFRSELFFQTCWSRIRFFSCFEVGVKKLLRLLKPG